MSYCIIIIIITLAYLFFTWLILMQGEEPVAEVINESDLFRFELCLCNTLEHTQSEVKVCLVTILSAALD